MTWYSDPPEPRPIRAAGYARALLRGSVLALWVFGGLAVLLTLRVLERPLFRKDRPVTPHVTQAVCRGALRVIGLRRESIGRPMSGVGAMVANHGSWLDIFVLNAGDRLYFVSKSEVATWPGIGWLARATGTLFIRRDRAEATVQQRSLEERLADGHRLLFFPEGTSSDGRRVLPFKPTLFQAFFTERFKDRLQVQPITVFYTPPDGEEPRFYGWWGDMDFGSHLAKVLAQARQGRVTVIYHAPRTIADFQSRKDLARACESAVHEGFLRLERGEQT